MCKEWETERGVDRGKGKGRTYRKLALCADSADPFCGNYFISHEKKRKKKGRRSSSSGECAAHALHKSAKRQSLNELYN